MSVWLELDRLGLYENGIRIVDSISTPVDAGRTVILGANGAGKSTLLRLMHGLLDPTEGRVCWPQPLSQGMVFQRPVMLRTTALANVEYGLKLRGTPAAQIRSLARHALKRVGLEALADRPARRLSGGEQQRVALARAWALQPQVLFLDEPTASLDPASSRDVERIILQIATEGTRIVMSTHNLAQARRLAESVMFLESGRLLEHCAAEQFFATPSSPTVRIFLEELIL